MHSVHRAPKVRRTWTDEHRVTHRMHPVSKYEVTWVPSCGAERYLGADELQEPGSAVTCILCLRTL